MKNFIVIILFLVTSTSTYSQNIDLTNKKELKNYLNGSSFKVGNYGSIKFSYDSYDKDFLMLTFKVKYTLFKDKRNKTYKFYTSFPLTYGGFYQPDFFKEFTISHKNQMSTLISDFPTRFQLLQNGELYFLDKSNSYTFNQYYKKTIKSGEKIYVKKNWRFCEKI